MGNPINGALCPPPAPSYRYRCPSCGHVESGLLKLVEDVRRLFRHGLAGLFRRPECPRCGERMVSEREPPYPWE